jgi:hypothetical protein
MARKSLLRRAESAAPGLKRGYDRRKANRISLQVVVVAAILFAGYMAVQLATEPAAVSDTGLEVRALFGFHVALSDIRELKLEKAPVAIGARVFGITAFGLFREGDFEVDGLGKARVFLKKPDVSYVTVKTDDKAYALSMGSLEKDQLLYDRIKVGMK